MASMNWFLAVVIASAFAVVVPAFGKEFVVGDGSGWTINFDYQAWAQGKEFHVGDKLIFNYDQGSHNVHRVDGAGFRECSAPATSVPLTTGNDVITLSSPGRKWYICGFSGHCETGNQKLVITVLPEVGTPAPTPSPATSPAGQIAAPVCFAWMAAAFGIFTGIMV